VSRPSPDYLLITTWGLLTRPVISLQGILARPNRCGSVSLPGTSQCGFGVVIAEVAGEEECFSRAVNVVPEWGYPAPKGTSGTWAHRGCWTDSAGTRTLAGGSVQDMEQIVEKCVATAKQFGFRYAGI